MPWRWTTSEPYLVRQSEEPLPWRGRTRTTIVVVRASDPFWRHGVANGTPRHVLRTIVRGSSFPFLLLICFVAGVLAKAVAKVVAPDRRRKRAVWVHVLAEPGGMASPADLPDTKKLQIEIQIIV